MLDISCPGILQPYPLVLFGNVSRSPALKLPKTYKASGTSSCSERTNKAKRFARHGVEELNIKYKQL